MSQQTVTKDPDNRKLVIERTFNTSRATLWRAWSTQELLEKWWGPAYWPTTTGSFDFREGGHWHYCMTGPDGTQAWVWVDYLDIDDQQMISAEDSFSDAEGNKQTELPQTEWLLEFSGEQPTTLKTTLLFSSVTDMEKLLEMGFEAGYTETLDKLEAYLERN